MEQFWTIFWTAIGILISGLMSWLTVVITNFFNSKIKDKKLAQHSTAVTTIVMNAVSAVFQSYVDTMKKAGTFTIEAQQGAKEKALKIIKAQLTEELLEYIKENFGDVQEYLNNQIEANIYMLKK